MDLTSCLKDFRGSETLTKAVKNLFDHGFGLNLKVVNAEMPLTAYGFSETVLSWLNDVNLSGIICSDSILDKGMEENHDETPAVFVIGYERQLSTYHTDRSFQADVMRSLQRYWDNLCSQQPGMKSSSVIGIFLYHQDGRDFLSLCACSKLRLSERGQGYSSRAVPMISNISLAKPSEHHLDLLGLLHQRRSHGSKDFHKMMEEWLGLLCSSDMDLLTEEFQQYYKKNKTFPHLHDIDALFGSQAAAVIRMNANTYSNFLRLTYPKRDGEIDAQLSEWLKPSYDLFCERFSLEPQSVTIIGFLSLYQLRLIDEKEASAFLEQWSNMRVQKKSPDSILEELRKIRRNAEAEL